MHAQEPQAISEQDLPLTLPETENFRPSGTPESPLANIADWVNFSDPVSGELRYWLSPCLLHVFHRDALVELLLYFVVLPPNRCALMFGCTLQASISDERRPQCRSGRGHVGITSVTCNPGMPAHL